MKNLIMKHLNEIVFPLVNKKLTYGFHFFKAEKHIQPSSSQVVNNLFRTPRPPLVPSANKIDQPMNM
jgi:hypothetical protein